MNSRYYLYLLCLWCIFSCNAANTELQANASGVFDQYAAVKNLLNKKILVDDRNYYLMAPSSDSTIQIEWGNSEYKRTFSREFELPLAENLSKCWVNKDYIILKYGTGIGKWKNIVLPLNAKENARTFNNILCFDSVYNLVVAEQSGDAILMILNLKTNTRQYISGKKYNCAAAIKTSCIDSIGISNKELYLKWITPHTLSDKQKIHSKKILLHI